MISTNAEKQLTLGLQLIVLLVAFPIHPQTSVASADSTTAPTSAAVRSPAKRNGSFPLSFRSVLRLASSLPWRGFADVLVASGLIHLLALIGPSCSVGVI